ncbi:hypothetical protein RAA17_16675 [Komagataeibacter rhaeticus]|nr:hypothetical protein [Komagataeibacter rhaeticus]
MEPENLELDKEGRQHEGQGKSPQKARTEGQTGEGNQTPTKPKSHHKTRQKTRQAGETSNTGTGNHPANIAGGEDGHITDFEPVKRTNRRQRPARPNPANPGPVANNQRTKQTDNHHAITHSESVIASAKIRKIGNRKPFKRAEKFTVITDEKLEEIRKKLKESKTGNRAFYREQYKNIKDQKYQIDCYNNQIDTNISLLLVDMFLRLFGYSLKRTNRRPSS